MIIAKLHSKIFSHTLVTFQKMTFLQNFLLTITILFFLAGVHPRYPRKYRFYSHKYTCRMCERKKMPKARILGGELTHIKKFPYIVSIQYKTPMIHFCGGTILNNFWILTAAHCVCYKMSKDMVPANKYVILSDLTNCRNGFYWTQIHDVESAYKHAKYDHKFVFNDIAVIKVHKSMKSTRADKIRATKLPNPHMFEFKSPSKYFVEPCTSIGWGATAENGTVTDMLRVVKLPLLHFDRCSMILGGGSYLTDKQVCTMVPQGGKDACQGDSGGPLVCGENNVQVGITSWGLGCGRAGLPGVWTRVDKYMGWINKVQSGQMRLQSVNSSIFPTNNIIMHCIIIFILYVM